MAALSSSRSGLRLGVHWAGKASYCLYTVGVSRGGDENHFLSAKERDLTPLLAEARESLQLGERHAWQLEVLVEDAWFSGLRNGHTKMLGQLRQRGEDPGRAEPPHPVSEATQVEKVKAELGGMMEASAELLELPAAPTLTVWRYLSRAWTAGVRSYEEEIAAALIEGGDDIGVEARRWLEGRDRDN